MEDEQIVALFLARSELAIAAAQEKYGVYCQEIAFRILEQRQDSEECVNDALLRAWNAIPPEQPQNLKAYLGRITRNQALNRRRAIRTEKRGGTAVELALSELRECVPGGLTPEDSLLQRQAVESIERFLRKQPVEKRAAFILRYWYLCSASEIAAKLGLRESTVRSMLFRLRKQLKTHLEQEGVL